MCLNPKWIYKKGFYKQDNYRGYEGQFYELGTYSKCGSCEICIAEKANNWVVRNYYEEKAHTKKSFITLTYKENPYILVRKDLQDFMKRLRINLDRTTGEKIRIFSASEYGTISNRPHHHIILYGWEDENAKYLDVNKKGNILYQSELIQDTWGLGRTSIQKFDTPEIAYLSLYNTSQETFKKGYLLTREKIKKLEGIIKNNHKMPKNQRENLYQELSQLDKEMSEKKAKYTAIKEFNSWSQGLGWNEFEKMYNKSNKYNFTEYIEEKEFVTPSPWVKRLANQGDIHAKNEMLRREQLITQSESEEKERIKNQLKIYDRLKDAKLEWIDKKTEIEITL